MRGEEPGSGRGGGVFCFLKIDAGGKKRMREWVGDGWIVGDMIKQVFSSVQSLSRVQLFATPWTAAHQASLSITNSRSLLKLMSIKSVMPSNYLILCHPLLLLPSIFPIIRVFSSESALRIRWPKYWSFSFSITPSNEYPRQISFRIDKFDLAVQGLSRVFSNTTVQKHLCFDTHLFHGPTLTSVHDY